MAWNKKSMTQSKHTKYKPIISLLTYQYIKSHIQTKWEHRITNKTTKKVHENQCQSDELLTNVIENTSTYPTNHQIPIV